MDRKIIRRKEDEEDSENGEIEEIHHGPNLSLEELKKLQEDGYNRTHGRVYYD